MLLICVRICYDLVLFLVDRAAQFGEHQVEAQVLRRSRCGFVGRADADGRLAVGRLLQGAGTDFFGDQRGEVFEGLGQVERQAEYHAEGLLLDVEAGDVAGELGLRAESVHGFPDASASTLVRPVGRLSGEHAADVDRPARHEVAVFDRQLQVVSLVHLAVDERRVLQVVLFEVRQRDHYVVLKLAEDGGDDAEVVHDAFGHGVDGLVRSVYAVVFEEDDFRVFDSVFVLAEEADHFDVAVDLVVELDEQVDRLERAVFDEHVGADDVAGEGDAERDELAEDGVVCVRDDFGHELVDLLLDQFGLLVAGEVEAAFADRDDLAGVDEVHADVRDERVRVEGLAVQRHVVVELFAGALGLRGLLVFGRERVDEFFVHREALVQEVFEEPAVVEHVVRVVLQVLLERLPLLAQLVLGLDYFLVSRAHLEVSFEGGERGVVEVLEVAPEVEVAFEDDFHGSADVEHEFFGLDDFLDEVELLVADLVGVDGVLDDLLEHVELVPGLDRHGLLLGELDVVVRREDVVALSEEELCEVQQRLRRLARAFDEALQRVLQDVAQVERVDEESGQPAVLFLDVDHLVLLDVEGAVLLAEAAGVSAGVQVELEQAVVVEFLGVGHLHGHVVVDGDADVQLEVLREQRVP